MPAHDMQPLRGRLQLRQSVEAVLRHVRRRIAAGHKRGGRKAGTAYGMRTCQPRQSGRSSAAVHTALELEPLCGAV